MCKKLKTVDFINMWLFFLESEIFNFCICQKSTFARSYLEQVSSWVIKSKFCVYKVSIRRHFIKLTFSGLHFFILWPPWIFNRGLSNPQWTRIRQNASLCSGAHTVIINGNNPSIQVSGYLGLDTWILILSNYPMFGYMDSWISQFFMYPDTWIHGYLDIMDTWIIGYLDISTFLVSG